MVDLKFESKEMNELVRYFLNRNISPQEALQIMSFMILTIIKLDESLKTWSSDDKHLKKVLDAKDKKLGEFGIKKGYFYGN